MIGGTIGEVKTDFLFGGQAYGDVAERLLMTDFDPGALRPWISQNGKKYVTLRNGQNLITNAPSLLTIDGYKRFEDAILRVQRPLVQVWDDIVGAGLVLELEDGLGTPVIVEQTMTDAGAATISMNPIKRSDRDRPEFDSRQFPIPIIHGEFSFDIRDLRVAARAARNGRGIGDGLDTTMAEMVTRRIVELRESWLLGTAGSYSYGGGTVYGITNKPERLTKTLTLPTAAGWTPEVTYNEVLEMIDDLQNTGANGFNGPYAMYFTKAWSKYMGQDYSSTYPGFTLRRKLNEIEDIAFSRKLRYGLTSGFQIIIFQLTSDVIRAINGGDIQMVSWDSHGGLARNWKLYCVHVPHVRHDAEDDCGVIHGVAA